MLADVRSHEPPLPRDYAAAALPVALLDTDPARLVGYLDSHGMAGRVDVTNGPTALQLTADDHQPVPMTIEFARSLATEFDCRVQLLRGHTPAGADASDSFTATPDGAFWPIAPAALPDLLAQVPTLLGPDDVVLVAQQVPGADESPTVRLPEGLTGLDPVAAGGWAATRLACGPDLLDILPDPAWPGLTLVIRLTGNEVTIWRAGRAGQQLAPLSWGYQRHWTHPRKGMTSPNPATVATRFATAWHNAGGSAQDKELAGLHQRRRMTPAVLRPALTALGVPGSLVTQLCGRAPAAQPWGTPRLAS